jgi:hypothetical protein
MQFVYFNILVRALALFAVVAFSSFAQSWVQINVTGTPPAGRFNDTAVYDASSERLIVFGGFNSATCCTPTNDVSVLTNANRQGASHEWITLIPANQPGSPPPLAAASAVYHAVTNRMIVFGGQHPTLGSQNDVWVLSNANGRGTPSWSRLTIGGALPPPRQNHQAVYDPDTNRMIVFGGLSFVSQFMHVN